MKRLVAIPLLGTAAALIVILLAHKPRAEAEPTPELPPFDFPDLPEHGGPDVHEPHEDTSEDPEHKEPTPEPREYQLELDANGALSDTETGAKYASAEELAADLKEVRHTLVITNADGVTEAALDEALAKLRDRYQVRKVYRAPEAPPGEGR